MPHQTAPLTISVLGAGAWGMTLAALASNAGHQVTLIAHHEERARHLDRYRAHPVSLPGFRVPASIRITHPANHRLGEARIVIVAVPTQAMRGAIGELAPALRDHTILSAAKGLEIGTLLRPSEIIREVLGNGTRVAAISGPNLSSEIAAGHPATTVIAADDIALAEALVPALHSSRFRVYASDDLVGVELGGALKNIIAIGAGIADGLEAGDNAKAAFLTRGIAEIARLGVACGARPLTFAGLSGIGDLIATCASPLSRNHRVGVALAQGEPLEAIIASMPEVAEGVPTTSAAVALAHMHDVELPIIAQMHRVLFEGVSPTHAIVHLMEREPARESPGTFR